MATGRRKQPDRRPERSHIAAVRSIVAVFREFEQVARDCDLNLNQYRTLLFLRTGPKRAGEITAINAVKKPTTTARIASLRDQGWIESRPDPDDARVSRIVLTDKGRARMDAFEAALAARLGELTVTGDQARIFEALSELFVALGDTKETRFSDLQKSLSD